MSNVVALGLARHQEEADGVAADFVDQVAHRHRRTRALAELHFPPIATVTILWMT
jgi:hypothetical protein